MSNTELITSRPQRRPAELTLQNRIDNYVKVTGYPRAIFLSEDGRIVGTWIMGNLYTVGSQLYGGYPHGYLRRIKAMFPDKKNVLHLFSGKVDTTIIPGKTLDIRADFKPDYCVNAQDKEAMRIVPLEAFDLIMADPAYSIEDSEHYGTPMINRNLVMRLLTERVRRGTHIVWLDQVLPMYRKDKLHIEALIGMVKSTNHRFRVITAFRRL